MSQLRRQLISLQKQQNKNLQVGPYSRASAANAKGTSATVSKGGSPRAKNGGSTRYMPKSSIANPSGGGRTPLNPPKPQSQGKTARQTGFVAQGKNGWNSAKGQGRKGSL